MIRGAGATIVQQPGDAMEQERAAGLNGWQRLWVAIALISIVAAAAMIREEWESADVWIRDLRQVPPNRVMIEGAGEVDFPATMSTEAIDLVTRGSGGNPEAIRAGITAWTTEFNKVIHSHVADFNRSLVIRGGAFWACGIALLYGVGWLVAWVRRGFRN
jgi:hypothetical protein